MIATLQLNRAKTANNVAKLHRAKTARNVAKLNRARAARNDEFYTRREDIDAAIPDYAEHMRGKVIYCNCDEPHSNFVRYFIDNFHALGMKKLIATAYKNQQLNMFAPRQSERAPWLEYDGALRRGYEGNGDFHSAECLERLKQADIVVTNPPFSMLREYVKLLMRHDKKFLIIAGINTVLAPSIGHLFVAERMWVTGIIPWFHTPSGDRRVPAWWVTNLAMPPRKRLALKPYQPHPRYDNYDAINVDKVRDIPDYDGAIGVPIRFLEWHNPAQFKLVEILDTPRLHGKNIFRRLIIRRV